MLAITGDGEQLMGLGALATIAVQRPANLTIVDQVATACGFAWASGVTHPHLENRTRQALGFAPRRNRSACAHVDG